MTQQHRHSPLDTNRPHTRFSDAGMVGLSTRSSGRRPKSAKARNRGMWAAAVPRVLWGFGHELRCACDDAKRQRDPFCHVGGTTSLEKVAAFLLEMDRRLAGADVLALPMTRRDIADYLGLTLETVSRELSHLRALGILKFAETSQRQIMLEDRQKLRRLNL